MEVVHRFFVWFGLVAHPPILSWDAAGNTAIAFAKDMPPTPAGSLAPEHLQLHAIAQSRIARLFASFRNRIGEVFRCGHCSNGSEHGAQGWI
jgi:hypothetical protein